MLPGMDYMYAMCSTTARRGALDWAPRFEAANRPVFEALYASVRDGTETRRSLEVSHSCSFDCNSVVYLLTVYYAIVQRTIHLPR